MGFLFSGTHCIGQLPTGKNKVQLLPTRITIPRTTLHEDNYYQPLTTNHYQPLNPLIRTNTYMIGNCPGGYLSGYKLFYKMYGKHSSCLSVNYYNKYIYIILDILEEDTRKYWTRCDNIVISSPNIFLYPPKTGNPILLLLFRSPQWKYEFSIWTKNH